MLAKYSSNTVYTTATATAFIALDFYYEIVFFVRILTKFRKFTGKISNNFAHAQVVSSRPSRRPVKEAIILTCCVLAFLH